MRLTHTLFLLPSLALAADQQPLADKVKGWFKQAQSYIPSSVPTPPNPVDAGASKIAERVVHTLTLENWKNVLQPSEQSKPGVPEEWMIYITGANKTCYGLCGRANAAWKEAVPLLSAQPHGPQLASVDCDAEQILCNAWAVGPPTIFVTFLPHILPDQSKPHTTLYSVGLNRTSVTAMEINNIHAKQSYKEQGAYEGYFHPFDGLVTQYGLAVPLGYLMWGMAKMPSWLPMVAISLSTRLFMGRRMGQAGRPAQGQGQAQGGAAQ